MQSFLHIGAGAKKKKKMAWQLRQPIKEAENKTKQGKRKKKTTASTELTNFKMQMHQGGFWREPGRLRAEGSSAGSCAALAALPRHNSISSPRSRWHDSRAKGPGVVPVAWVQMKSPSSLG